MLVSGRGYIWPEDHRDSRHEAQEVTNQRRKQYSAFIWVLQVFKKLSQVYK